MATQQRFLGSPEPPAYRQVLQYLHAVAVQDREYTAERDELGFAAFPYGATPKTILEYRALLRRKYLARLPAAELTRTLRRVYSDRPNMTFAELTALASYDPAKPDVGPV